MKITVSKKTGFSKLQKFLLSWLRRIHYRSSSIIEVKNNGENYKFKCNSAIEEYRAASLFSKEPGTVNWIMSEFSEGDVYLDIGANVGVYTLLGGAKVGESGHVYAIEPHVVNYVSLLNNIQINRMESICTPMCLAISSGEKILPFYYASFTAGSSMSQLGVTKDPDGNDVSKGLREIKYAVSIDTLISDNIIKPPHHIKIDVDGIEADIVEGMTKLLLSERKPLTIQIEVQPDTRDDVLAKMKALDYSVASKHVSEHSHEILKKGEDIDDVTHNIIFSPVAT